jgi:hypothetical protein
MSDLYYRFPYGSSDVQDKVKHLKDRADALSAVATKLDGVSEQTMLTEMAKLYTSFAGCMALLAKQLPYQAGDRVFLVKAPKCEGGWASSKHFLVIGAPGTIKSIEIDYLMRDWSVYVEFDNESWIASTDFGKYGDEPPRKAGDVIPVKPEDRHVFGFSRDYIAKFPI